LLIFTSFGFILCCSMRVCCVRFVLFI